MNPFYVLVFLAGMLTTQYLGPNLAATIVIVWTMGGLLLSPEAASALREKRDAFFEELFK